MDKSGQRLITGTYVLLLLYNTIYWWGKIANEQAPSFIATTYTGIKENWGLLTFLEMLAVVSIFVDIVVGWDKLIKPAKQIKLTLVTLLFVSFVFRLITGMMDLLLGGELR